MSDQLDTSVAVIIFNRPDRAARLIGALARVEPKRLFVIADGPRASVDTDADLCLETRLLFDNLPWRCEVNKIYAAKNLGLRERVLSGLDQVFSQTDRAIILEDDCIPDPTFFGFANEVLALHADDRGVSMLSGKHFGFQSAVSGRWHFSRHVLIWGWATWADRWHEFRSSRIGSQLVISDQDKRKLWLRIGLNPLRWILFRIIERNSSTTWDVFLASWSLLEGKRAVVPGVNLVENIGFGEASTHTSEWVPDVAMPAGRVKLPLVCPRVSQISPFIYDMNEFLARTLRWLRFSARHPVQFATKVARFVGWR